MVILENYRKTTSVKWLALLPAVMLFWANAHGGFILGDVLIIIVCLSEAVKYFFIRKPAQPLTERKLLWLLVIGLASIMVSYVNPNSSYAFIFAFRRGNFSIYQGNQGIPNPSHGDMGSLCK